MKQTLAVILGAALGVSLGLAITNSHDVKLLSQRVTRVEEALWPLRDQVADLGKSIRETEQQVDEIKQLLEERLPQPEKQK